MKWAVIRSSRSKKYLVHPMSLSIPNGYRIISLYLKNDTAKVKANLLNDRIIKRKTRRKSRRAAKSSDKTISAHNCKQKVRFISEATAMGLANKLAENPKRRKKQIAYKCEHCTCWHLTTVRSRGR